MILDDSLHTVGDISHLRSIGLLIISELLSNYLHEIMHRIMEFELAETVDSLDICLCDSIAYFRNSICIRLSDGDRRDRECVDFFVLCYEVELSSTETSDDIVCIRKSPNHELV